ncbi:MAG TPA: YHS domain-containing protein [Puia sp.]|nr:YHS domain-containing protein [Puia sp.]
MRKLFYIISLSLLGACHGPSTDENPMPKAKAAISRAADAAAKLKNLQFDYPKDPACGMPLKAGLEDSTEYKGKLYGFCSKECKEEFLKSPESFLAHLTTP